MEVNQAVKTRRSVRRFSNETVSESEIQRIVEAGRWAPSGLNNQPWKVVVVRDVSVVGSLASLTKYSKIILSAPVNLAVFYDESEGYDRTKDVLAVGAFIQNMLLEIHEMGLGACWLGEILNQALEVETLLNVPSSCRLMAVVALGRPDAQEGHGVRRPLNEIIIGNFT